MSGQDVTADEKAATSKALMEQLKNIAIDYRAALNDDGPTVKQLAKDADDIERLASELAGKIKKQHADLVRLARIHPFEGAIAEYASSDGGAIAKNLNQLSLLQGKLRAQIISEIGSGDPDKPDKGGAPTAAHALAGSPQQRFVNQLAIFWFFEYGMPTTTNDGEFLSAAWRVHAMAVGEKSDGLKEQAGQAVAMSKDMIKAFEEALADVVNHVSELRQTHPDMPSDDALLGPIKAIGKLFRERKSRRKPAKPDTPQED